jgi:intein-encoded DNA endonuclease-like protein
MTEKVVVQDPGPQGEGHTPQGHIQEGRGKYLPRELRIRLFEEVNRLRRNSLTYSEIIDKIRQTYGVRLCRSNVSYWLRGIKSPFNGRYIPSIEFLRPSEELAYVIGVIVGDGYATRSERVVKNYNRVRIGLMVKDREFAAEFGRCLAKVLGRQPFIPKHSSGQYIIEVHSQTLYELLKKPVDLERLKKYIEHCERCTAAFIRGFADSEGSVVKIGYIYIYNTDYELLTYVKDLLKRLGIKSTGPWTKRQQGRTLYDPKKMKRYVCNKDEYYIYVKTCSNINFYKNIGFTIRRKQKRLENYVKKHQTRKHRRCPAKPPLPSLYPFSCFDFCPPIHDGMIE